MRFLVMDSHIFTENPINSRIWRFEAIHTSRKDKYQKMMDVDTAHHINHPPICTRDQISCYANPQSLCLQLPGKMPWHCVLPANCPSFRSCKLCNLRNSASSVEPSAIQPRSNWAIVRLAPAQITRLETPKTVVILPVVILLPLCSTTGLLAPITGLTS